LKTRIDQIGRIIGLRRRGWRGRNVTKINQRVGKVIVVVVIVEIVNHGRWRRVGVPVCVKRKFP